MSGTLARLSRRAFVAALLTGLRHPARADAPSPFVLTFRSGRLIWPGGQVRAACGKAGVSRDKREGDMTTPAGDFPLLQVFYRPDRLPPPVTGLPSRPLELHDAWIDDPRDSRYNTLAKLPCSAHVERLWRRDELYDLMVVIGYNVAPVRPYAGSAVFLHVARPGYPGTAGCLAVDRETLQRLVARLDANSRIRIEG